MKSNKLSNSASSAFRAISLALHTSSPLTRSRPRIYSRIPHSRLSTMSLNMLTMSISKGGSSLSCATSSSIIIARLFARPLLLIRLKISTTSMFVRIPAFLVRRVLSRSRKSTPLSNLSLMTTVFLSICMLPVINTAKSPRR